MSARGYLGELEDLILLMVALIGTDAYGVSVAKELEEQTGRVISISATPASLHRLEGKRIYQIENGWAFDPGACRKRLFQITYGRQTLEELRDMRNTTWAPILNT